MNHDMYDPQFVRVDFGFTVSTKRGNPEDFFIPVHGRINVLTDDDETLTLGQIECRLLNLHAAEMETDMSRFVVMDGSAESLQVYEEMFDSDSDWEGMVPAADKILGDSPLDLGVSLLISRVEIKPEHRGHGVGLMAVRAAIDHLGDSDSAVIIRPFPLQFEGQERDEKTFKEAKAKLAKYWGKAGFKPVKGTGFMALSRTRKLPSMDVMLKGRFGNLVTGSVQ